VAFAATDKWLYIGITGSSGTTGARVLAYDGIGFHYVWEVTGSGVTTLKDIAVYSAISSDDDLYILYSDGGSSKLAKIAKISKNPLTDSAKKYAASGVLVTPNFDGGMAEDSAAILATGMGVNSLNSDETIKVETEIDYSGSYEGAASEIATFNADTDKLIQYGTSTRGKGMPGQAWRHKYTLSRGSTNTNTPIMFSAVTYYRKKPAKIHEIAFLIDLEEAVRQNQWNFTDADNVMELLHNAEESVELVELIFPGKKAVTGVAVGTALFVDVEGVPSSHLGNEAFNWTPRIQSGTTLVICRQIFT